MWLEVKEELSPDIKVIKTSGHSKDSISLVVNTPKGRIVICGDVF